MFLKWFYRISAFLVFILLLILVRFGWAIRDRHPDADMNVHIETEEDFLQAEATKAKHKKQKICSCQKNIYKDT